MQETTNAQDDELVRILDEDADEDALLLEEFAGTLGDGLLSERANARSAAA
jgi:hypothetical protein